MASDSEANKYLLNRPQCYCLNMILFLLVAVIIFTGCGSGYGIYHRVKAGESFEMICRAYDVDQEDVARVNSINDMSAVKAGDAIWIPMANRQIDVKSISPPPPARGAAERPVAAEKKSPEKRPGASVKGIGLAWPVVGDVVAGFGGNNDENHDGIDISAVAGTKIKAAAPGRVVYSGSELKGYGNLVIIKHEGTYSTVYAHNQENLVKKGDFVKQGQVVALIGSSEKNSDPSLHFEVRRGKDAVNPLQHLPGR